MYSRVTHAGSNTMRKQNKQQQPNKKKKSVNALTRSMKKVTFRTPFSDVGGLMGTAAGSMFGAPHIGASVGRWLGSGIGSIFGSGDYTMVGSKPDYNVLTNNNQIPKFQSDGQANIVTHREYLGDISGTAAFTNNAYPLNPGMSKTFPWLSTVANCYQEYKWHGLIFEFRPLTTDYANAGVPGVIIMSTNYNADSPLYLSKQQMENSEFAVSTKPTLACIHGVECAITQNVLGTKYVRNTVPEAGQDLRLFDQGTFQFATQANSPSIVLGELWVSYSVELMKPILPETISSGISHFVRSSVAGVTFMGTIGVIESVNELGITLTSNTVTFPNALTGTFTITVSHFGTGVLCSGIGAPVVTNGAVVPLLYNNHTENFAQSPNGIASQRFVYQHVVTLTPNNVSTVVTYSAGTFPTSSYIDIFISATSSSVV